MYSYYHSDGQTPLMALDSFQNNIKFFWDCVQPVMSMAAYNRSKLMCMPGHKEMTGNETATLLANLEAQISFVGPKLACGISGFKGLEE
jgi:hypothetical protein